jgi:transposase
MKVFDMGYSSDLRDGEWEELEPILLGLRLATGGRRKHSLRRVMDGIFYVCENGCKWRNLPSDLPPWRTVYIYKRHLEKRGHWEEIHEFFLNKNTGSGG